MSSRARRGPAAARAAVSPDPWWEWLLGSFRERGTAPSRKLCSIGTMVEFRALSLAEPRLHLEAQPQQVGRTDPVALVEGTLLAKVHHCATATKVRVVPLKDVTARKLGMQLSILRGNVTLADPPSAGGAHGQSPAPPLLQVPMHCSQALPKGATPAPTAPCCQLPLSHYRPAVQPPAPNHSPHPEPAPHACARSPYKGHAVVHYGTQRADKASIFDCPRPPIRLEGFVAGELVVRVLPMRTFWRCASAASAVLKMTWRST